MGEYSDSVVATQRRAAGHRLINIANVIKAQSEMGLDEGMGRYNDFIDDKEAVAIEKIRKALAAVDKNLHGLAKRMGAE